MQGMGTGSGALVARMQGAARLNPHTYEEVERDTTATGQAAIVVVLAAVAAGIGSIRDEWVGGLIGGIFTGVIGWAFFAGIAFLIGTRLLAGAATSATWGQLLRTLVLAYTPSLLAVFGFIPVLGPLLAFVGGVWFIVASVIALRHALDISTGRAVAVGILASLAPIVLIAIVGLFGLTLYGIGSLF